MDSFFFLIINCVYIIIIYIYMCIYLHCLIKAEPDKPSTQPCLFLKGRWPRFQARAPPISFLTIEGRAAANPPPFI